jgi:uncharacterized protein (TIGR03083 family)
VTRTRRTRFPTLPRGEARALAAQENERFVGLVGSLDADDWTRPTDCPDWDVRAVAAHVLGAMEGHVSLPVMVRQQWAGKRIAGDRPDVDGMTEIQVREQRHLGPQELVGRLADLGPRAAATRAARPALLRRMTFAQTVGTSTERWTLGYLLDVILTRDTWMHRVDISRAIHRPLQLTPDHDGRIVGDIAAEWAHRHSRPYTLTLTGPAGGSFSRGHGGPDLELDAVEFCRILSGRETGTGLLTQPVPF